MCGRYQLLYTPMANDPAISHQLLAVICQHASGEVFPAEPVLAFYQQQGVIEAFAGSWGFTFRKRRVINARLETLGERPLFRPYARCRCVLPCNCYYEWQQQERGKQRMRIAHPHCSRIYLAAIYNEEKEVCVLTMAAQGHLALIHDRMPILLDEKGMRAYLRGEQGVRTVNGEMVAQPDTSAI